MRCQCRQITIPTPSPTTPLHNVYLVMLSHQHIAQDNIILPRTPQTPGEFFDTADGKVLFVLPCVVSIHTPPLQCIHPPDGYIGHHGAGSGGSRSCGGNTVVPLLGSDIHTNEAWPVNEGGNVKEGRTQPHDLPNGPLTLMGGWKGTLAREGASAVAEMTSRTPHRSAPEHHSSKSVLNLDIVQGD